MKPKILKIKLYMLKNLMKCWNLNYYFNRSHIGNAIVPLRDFKWTSLSWEKSTYSAVNKKK
jgi:hypothetical protein